MTMKDDLAAVARNMDTWMEVIQRDSHAHMRVQQMIKGVLERETIELSPEELDEIWDDVEKYISVARPTVDIARASQDVRQTGQARDSIVSQRPLSYLLPDGQKHTKLLDNLGLSKRNIASEA